jgi:eukaryotic-like serine/threonine-protein kinase
MAFWTARISIMAESPRSAPADDRDLATGIWPPANSSAGSLPSPPTPPAISRFRILRSHAKGGLGEVFVACDEELNREVALKEIQAQFAFQPEHRSRFLIEAEITGSLEHPGIVPVYALGSYPDGRPYYAMRFIKGDSLQEAISQFHTKDEVDRNLQERTLAMRELLGRFVDVCQAIAYAHSRGVLHRDLKPGNVMLGKYGETLVVDWGLAKVLIAPSADNPVDSEAQNPPASVVAAESPTLLGEPLPRHAEMAAPSSAGSSSTSAVPAAERPITPRSTPSKEMATQMGQTIGSPAYMSPEQAAGSLDQMGPASDVYSLGATLYHLLTGRPPFDGDDLPLILRQVQLGEFPRPREIKRSIPPALEAVCLKALALVPADRYASALDLAAEVERWLADEPVLAYQEPLMARTRRWLARHRVATTSAGVAAVMALVGMGIVLVLSKASEEKERQLRSQETTAKELATHNLALAEVAQREEARQQKLARDRLEKGVEAVERMVSRVTGEKWANRPELDGERREMLEEAVGFFKELGSEASADPTVRRLAARAYLQSGNVQIALGEYAKAATSARRALGIYQGLNQQFPSDVVIRQGVIDATVLNGGLDTLSGRYEDARAQFEKAVLLAEDAARIDREGEGILLARGDALVALARIHSITDPAKSQQFFAQALANAESLAAKPKPSYRACLQVAICLVEKGVLEMSQGRNDQGNSSFVRARTIIAVTDPMHAPTAQSAALMSQTRATMDGYQGIYFCSKGKTDEGLALIRRGIGSLRRLRDLTPSSFSYQFQLMQQLIAYGRELTRQDKGNEVSPVMQEIDQIRSKLLREVPQMVWLTSLGDLQRSEWLIWKAKRGQTAGIGAEMDALLNRSDTRTRQALAYNSACLFAHLAASGPEADRERNALEAVKRLNDLLAGSYFEIPNNRTHLDDDPDLVPLRDRLDFKNFVEKAKSVRPKSK